MVRVLIDEDIDIAFRQHVGEFATAETVQFRGWKGVKNGRLLRLAEAEYDALITMDDSLPHQQNVAAFGIAILVLKARSKRLPDLLECLPALKAELAVVKPGTATRIFPRDS